MLRGEPCQELQNSNINDLGKKLLDACKNGETEEVRDLMQNGAPFTTDWLGTSPLHFAAQNGHTETAEILLRAGVSRDARTKVERTPLHLAAQEGHLDIVRLLIENSADLDAQDLLKMTPLHWAVERGYYHVVEFLVDSGASVNITSKFDKTPIDIARDSGRSELIPILEKNLNVSRPRHDSKSSGISASKSKATVLPNKANRTSKVMKAQISSSNISNKGTTSINISKTSVDALKKLLNGSGMTLEDNSKDVLTTLAALAEATGATNAITASNHSSEAAEALKWIDSNSTYNSDDNIFTSALESGGTVSLTEAGKLVLNSVTESTSLCSSSPITLDSSIITNNSPVLFVTNSSTSSSTLDNPESSRNKKVPKTNTRLSSSLASSVKANVAKTVSSIASNGCTLTAYPSDLERLKKEIEKKTKELDEYRAKVREREKELDLLNKQLESIQSREKL